MKIIFHPKTLDYQGTLGNPRRLINAYKFLKEKYDFVEPEILLKKPTIHTKELIEKVKSGRFYNPDSPAYPEIYDYAMLAINGALTAQKLQGFSIIEPPGHHAGKDFLGGFCYFNNIAEAVIQSKLKTLIIDIDGHHGNGTQDIIENSENIFFISLHRRNWYPGTGNTSGKNFINIPLEENCGEEKYLEELKKSIIKINFKPEQIAISAGFDAYKKDSLASLRLEKETYFKIGKIINKLTKKTNSRIFAVLEGGYSEELGELIDYFIKGIKK